MWDGKNGVTASARGFGGSAVSVGGSAGVFGWRGRWFWQFCWRFWLA